MEQKSWIIRASGGAAGGGRALSPGASMKQGGLRRWTSEGGTPRRVPLRPSREGSAPAVSPEVRCACQFFQSDSILPDRKVPRPALSRVSTLTRSDHEYEPIGKPVTETEIRASAPPKSKEIETPVSMAPPATPPPPAVFVSDPELAPQLDDDASSTTSHERQFLRPPTEDDTTNMDYEGDDTEPPSSSIALQKQIEDRYFVNTPTTTESRTDCEVSTSQVDSSALENLPLKRENRKRNIVGEEASKLQQKIKLQTGKLKTKLKTIKKPQFSMPERPKFNMPERPKFNMPERPKFNLPERPKFNMPERPKFTMPERPKINLPDRPKFRMPERPKFNMPDKPKFLEKAKFNMPDRPKFTMPDRSKFKLPDRPKLNFSAFTRNKENSQKEKSDMSTDSTSGSKKRKIEFDFRTYPRFSRFKKDKKGGKTTKGERPGTPPPSFATMPRVTKDRQAVMSTSHWEDMSSNMSSEEPRHYGLPKDYPPSSEQDDFESKLAQVDKDYNQMQEEYEREKVQVAKVKLENAELWNAMEKSSAQRLEHRGSLPFYPSGNEHNNEEFVTEVGDDESSAASTGHHRRGVLEEIDNDEFFLRQKGISQDNIEVGKYLSDEIRDAFRSPVNALHQMDGAAHFDKDKNKRYLEHMDGDENDFDDNLEKTDLNDDVDHSQDVDHDDGYYTFPPVRPSRSRKQKQALQGRAQLENESTLDNDSSLVESIPAPPMFQEPPPPVKREQETVERSETPRKSMFSSTFKDTEVLQNLNEYENEMDQTRDIPTIPKRRKKATKDFNYSENGSLFNEPYEEDDKWMKPKDQDDRMIDDEIIVHRMEYVMPSMESELPEESPVAPRRMRSRSRGSRATSACDDDRTSHGAESLTLDSHTHLATAEIEWNLDDIPDDPGYAIVEKTLFQKKSEPPPRPPAPVRRHRSSKSLSGDRQFFTVPRALKESTPPKRPSRNYSTLGPSRPPRKKSTTSLTDLKSIPQEKSTSDATQYVEIDDEEFDPHKDLQSGDVISKMKHRPLPPPPRPPRGPRRRRDLQNRQDDEQFIDDSIQFNGSVEEVEIFEDKDVIIDDFDVDEAPIDDETPLDDEIPIDDEEHEEIIEIEVSTQTDPLPDDFDFTIGMDEPFMDSEKQVSTSQNETLIDDVEENSIDAEILSRGLQRFRESSRPSSRSGRAMTPVERTKTPIDRPKTPLGRMSPTAILVERRVSSPTRIDERNVMITEASLTVIPIDDPDSYETDSKSFSSQKPIVARPERDESPKPTIEIEEMPLPISEPEIVPLTISHILSSPPKPIEQPEPPVQSIPIVLPEPVVQSAPVVLPEPTVPSTPIVLPQQVAQIESIYPEPIPREKPSEMWQALNSNTPILPSLTENKTPPPPPSPVVAPEERQIIAPAPLQVVIQNPEVEIVKAQRMQVCDLEVERLAVGELQASKILVSEIEGLSLQVSDINSKSGNLVVRGIEFSPEIFDEILQKFAQLAPPSAPVSTQTTDNAPKEQQTRPEVSQQTQTDSTPEEPPSKPTTINVPTTSTSTEPPLPPPPLSPSTSHEIPQQTSHHSPPSPSPPPPPPTIQEVIFEMQQHAPHLEFTLGGDAPERPPLPQIPGSIYPMGYYPEYSLPPASFYRLRPPPERQPQQPELSEGDPPLPSSRRRKHKREVVSSSDEEYRPAPRRAPPAPRSSEPSVAELSSQLFRACQNSVSRTARYALSYISSQFATGENKKDVQMALVIVLVMIAGLILLGVGDGRTVHHHHWDFFNPPNDK